MRFMVLVKASKETEAGVMPSTELLTAMGKFNEEMAAAGVMVTGEGLHPSSKGVRLRYTRGAPTVIDGPFTETKEIVCGFWIIETRSRKAAIDWLKKAPFGPGAEIEIRQIFTTEDFGEAFTPELQAQEERIREKVGQK